MHGWASNATGPYVPLTDNSPQPGVRDPLSRFSTNPHIAYYKPENRFLLFFNGRRWPTDDLTNCQPNRTGAAPWHGGGACSSDHDCPGALAHTNHAQTPGKCIDGRCQCEHHSFGLHCTEMTETVNVAWSVSPAGPWTQLLPDGAPFWSGPGGGNDSLALSNPSAWVLDNGSVVLAYSRAPSTGLSMAPHWRGPYTRLSLPGKSPGSPRNYTLAGCGEDPFVYRDFRGTWRVLCHGKTLPAGQFANGTLNPAFPTAKLETIGQAWSKDLVHWTPGPTAVATSLMEYADGTIRAFARRERPALLLDDRGFPTHLFTAVQGPGANYSCHSDTDRGCHAWSFVHPTRHGATAAA